MQKFTLCAFADEAGASVGEQIAALRENGIPCLEVRGVEGRNITDLTYADAKSLRIRLEEEGVRVWSVGSPIGKVGIEENFEEHFTLFQHVLDLADALGAFCVRLFSFYMPQGENPLYYRDEVLERMNRFTDEARGSGITLCHENEKGIFGDVAGRCAELHENCPDLRAVFDPANFIQCGQPVGPAWKLLAPYVKYLHIKDCLADGTVVPAGKGIGQIPQLLADFYNQGGEVLTLEPHLAVFEGLGSLEAGEKTNISEFAFPTQRAAFDEAARALKALLR